VDAVSRKARYALRALYVFSRADVRCLLSADTLAKRANTPRKFIEVILLGLTRAGILASKKGKGGGYSLRLPSSEISVGEIIRSIDGLIDPLPCLRDQFPELCEDCLGDAQTCGTRLWMARLREAIAGVLDATTLAEAATPRADGAPVPTQIPAPQKQQRRHLTQLDRQRRSR
jgi:Rrf2 family protein